MKTLIAVWAALLALLALSAGTSLMTLGPGRSEALSLAISAAKTLLVVLFFMELRTERWAPRLAAVAAALMLALLLGGTLSDFLARPRDQPLPPGSEAAFQ